MADENPSLAPGSVHWFVKQIEQRLEAQKSEIQEIKQMVQELAAYVDTAFPGADLKFHYEEHKQSIDSKIERRRNWLALKMALLVGLVLGISVLIGMFLWSAGKHL